MRINDMEVPLRLVISGHNNPEPPSFFLSSEELSTIKKKVFSESWIIKWTSKAREWLN